MTTMTDPRDQLRAAMQAKGLSIAALAKQTGSSADKLSRYLNGLKDVQVGTLRRWAEAVGLTLTLR